jgi:hypothetical protein
MLLLLLHLRSFHRNDSITITITLRELSTSLFKPILLINKVRKPWVVTFRILAAFSIQQNH